MSERQEPETNITVAAPVDQTPISIVSNSRLLREGLITLLAHLLDCRLIGSYAGADEASTGLRTAVGHIVLLDGNLGPHMAEAWLNRWRTFDPTTRVIMLEIAPSADEVLHYVEAGACGYTVQGASIAEVAEAIRAAQRGEAHCAPAVVAVLFARLADQRPHPALPTNGLTPREIEVLRYLADHYSNQAIADALVIEVRTVKHHVHNILEKLKAHSRHEAALLALQRGWLLRERITEG